MIRRLAFFPLVMLLAGIFGAFVGSVSGVYWFFNLDLEQTSFLFWALLCGGTTAIALIAASRLQRMPTRELASAIGLLWLVSGLWVFAIADLGLASPLVQDLLVAPAALWLCAYFGASLGYMIWGDGAAEMRSGYENLIGRRLLLARTSPVLSTVTSISVIGVSLGVWLVLVSLAVLSGFESDLQTKIIGANAHITVQAETSSTVDMVPEQWQGLQQLPGVVAVAPFLESEAAIASQSNYTGALMFGIDPKLAPQVLTLLQHPHKGSLAPLLDVAVPEKTEELGEFAAPNATPSVVLGIEMSKMLNVRVGDTVRMISPTLDVLTPVGVAPKSMGLKVAAIFSSQMYEYDARYAYVNLATLQRFLEMGQTTVTGLQLRCEQPGQAATLASVVEKQLTGQNNGTLRARTWEQRNQTLFSALKLERVIAFIVLVFIILVASFSIVNTLTMSITEKRKEIAILKTMGARDVGVMKIFLVQGLLVGVFGTLIGTSLAIGTISALEHFGFGIPGEVYYIDSLPVHLEGMDVLVVVVAALLIVWDFAVYPALAGARLTPVEGLRDG